MSKAHHGSGQRVVFLYAYAHDEKDAVANAVRQLASALGDHGFSAQVYVVRPRPTSGRLSRVQEQVVYFVRALALVLLHRKRIDILVTVDVPTGLAFVGRLARMLSANRIQHIGWVMDLYQFQPGATGRLASLRRAVDRISLRQTEILVTLGSCMAELIRSQTGRRAEVIPIWQDGSWLEPLRSDWRERTGVPEGLFLLYSGHAGDQHPLRELVDAVEIANRTTAVTLVIAGRGSHFNEERDRAKVTGASHVLFREPVAFSEVPTMLSAADVHIISLGTPFTGTCVPSKTYSAMAVGRPSLFIGASEGQAAIDILNAGAGEVTDSDSSAATLASIVVGLAGDREELERQGARGRAFFLRERSLTSQSAEWATLLNRGQSRVKNES